MNYKITKAFTFDAAHRLPHYDGPCANMHGHTWRVEVTLSSDLIIGQGPKRGMVVDFKDIKRLVGPLIDSIDHQVLNDVEGLIGNPTAEVIAAWLFRSISAMLRADSPAPVAPKLHAVKVWESADSCCEVTATMAQEQATTIVDDGAVASLNIAWPANGKAPVINVTTTSDRPTSTKVMDDAIVALDMERKRQRALLNLAVDR